MRYKKGGARNRASFWKCLTGGEACRNGDFRECLRTLVFVSVAQFLLQEARPGWGCLAGLKMSGSLKELLVYFPQRCPALAKKQFPL